MSNRQPDAARSSNNDPQDLEQAIAAGRRERGQLLRHIIGQDDEIVRYRDDRASLRRECDGLRLQLSQRDGELKRLRASPPATGSRWRRALAYIGAAAVAAFVSATMFDRTTYRPMQATLQNSIAGLETRVKQDEAETQRLQTELSAAREALTGASIPTEPTAPSPVAPSTDGLAEGRKALADQMGAVDLQSKRLAELKRNLDLENERLAAARNTLERDRATFQVERKTPAAIGPVTPANAGVLIWRATTTVQTAVMITMNKSNFGSVSGALPGREASLEIIVRQGNVKIFERPDASNKWSRFYFQVAGSGPAMVYVVWTLTG